MAVVAQEQVVAVELVQWVVMLHQVLVEMAELEQYVHFSHQLILYIIDTLVVAVGVMSQLQEQEVSVVPMALATVD
jgi:hypothetical protein